MDRVRVGSMPRSSSQLGIRLSSIKVKLKGNGTEVVPNPQMHPHLNQRSHPTHRPPLVLVMVNLHIPYMRQRETPRCTPRLSPLPPQSGPVAVALKVKSNIIIWGLPPTHSQRKPISSHRTHRPRTRQEHTRFTPRLDPRAVALDQSYALRLPWRLDLFLPVQFFQRRFLRRQGRTRNRLRPPYYGVTPTSPF